MTVRGAPSYFVAVVQPGKEIEYLDLTDRVIDFTFEDHERKVDTLRLTVDNEDLSNFDEPVFATGNVLRFSFGYAEEGAPIREAIIRKVKGGRTLTVEAHSKAVLMDKEQKRRRFENMTRSEVVRQIAQEHGFGDNVIIDDVDEVHETIVQANYTDAQMLRKLAHLEHFEFFVDFDGIHWHRRKTGQRPMKKFIYYSDPALGSIQDFNVENDVTRKPGRVRVMSRNPITGETIEAVSENATETDRDVLQEFPAIGTFTGEGGILQVQAGSTATKQTPSPQETASQEVTRPSNVQTEADAKREAKGRFIKVQQTAVKMTLELIGEPGVLAKSVIEIENMGRRLSGKYYVREAIHKLDSSGGYDTTLKLITDGYQHGHGRGGGRGGASAANLISLVQALQVALNATPNLELQAAGLRIVQQAAHVAGDPRPATCAPVAQACVRLAVSAKKLGETAVGQAAANLAAGLRRVVDVEEETADGKLNKKSADGADPGKLTPQEIEKALITGETGALFKFVDKRGRDD